MAIQVDTPVLNHKYITLFSTEAEYNTAYPNFEEVNWSDVAYPEERPDEYRLSRRLSNMYHKNVPPDYKFDNVDDYVIEEKLVPEKDGEGHYIKDDDGHIIWVNTDVVIYPDAHQIATCNDEDDIRKTFFLEIVWGYSGWEWHDYDMVIGVDPIYGEPITETLTGGNLYKIKDIQTVPHIIDGARLQHINDFLFSQYNVTTVEGFNTVNLKAINRAFKRGTDVDTTYPKRPSSEIKECHLVDAYDENENLLNHYFGYGDTLENVVEADGLFYNNKIYINQDNPEGSYINIPNIEKINRFYYCGAYTPGLKFKMESLKEFTEAFTLAMFNVGEVDLNEIFLGDTLNNIEDFSQMFAAASIVGETIGEPGSEQIISSVKLDLTNSNVSQDTVINFYRFFYKAGPLEYNTLYGNSVLQNSVLSFDFDFNNKVDLTSMFASVLRTNKNSSFNEVSSLRNGVFEKISLNFHNKEAYITNTTTMFATDTFIENVPIQQVPNNECDDTKIYLDCTFNVPVSYDFLNGSIVSPRTQGYGQFNNCTFNNTFTFSNIQGLDRVEFCGISFGNNVEDTDRVFPYIVQDQNDTTYRYVDFTKSGFVSISDQNFYIDTERYCTTSDKYVRTGSGVVSSSQINIFQQCARLSFSVSHNVHVYYKDIIDPPSGSRMYTGNIELRFEGNTAMVTTPYIHFLLNRRGNTNFGIYCRNMTNLENVNFENVGFKGTSTSYINPICHFNNCVNLKYLKIGTNTVDGFEGGIDLSGCHYDDNGVWKTHLDIATLSATLLKMTRGPLIIMHSALDQLETDYPDTYSYCYSHFTVTAVDDASYNPNS